MAVALGDFPASYSIEYIEESAYKTMPSKEREIWDLWKAGAAAPSHNFEQNGVALGGGATKQNQYKLFARALELICKRRSVTPTHAKGFVLTHEFMVPLLKAHRRVFCVERNLAGGMEG